MGGVASLLLNFTLTVDSTTVLSEVIMVVKYVQQDYLLGVAEERESGNYQQKCALARENFETTPELSSTCR